MPLALPIVTQHTKGARTLSTGTMSTLPLRRSAARQQSARPEQADAYLIRLSLGRVNLVKAAHKQLGVVGEELVKLLPVATASPDAETSCTSKSDRRACRAAGQLNWLTSCAAPIR